MNRNVLLFYSFIVMTLSVFAFNADAKTQKTSELTRKEVFNLVNEAYTHFCEKRSSLETCSIESPYTFNYQFFNMDQDAENELITSVNFTHHLGIFCVFDVINGKYKMIYHDSRHVTGWDFNHTYPLKGHTIFKLHTSTGGIGVEVHSDLLFYVQNQKFVIAWEGITQESDFTAYPGRTVPFTQKECTYEIRRKTLVLNYRCKINRQDPATYHSIDKTPITTIKKFQFKNTKFAQSTAKMLTQLFRKS